MFFSPVGSSELSVECYRWDVQLALTGLSPQACSLCALIPSTRSTTACLVSCTELCRVSHRHPSLPPVPAALPAGGDEGSQVWRLRQDHPEGLEEVCGPQEVRPDEGRRWEEQRPVGLHRPSSPALPPSLSRSVSPPTSVSQLPICCWTERRGDGTVSTGTLWATTWAWTTDRSCGSSWARERRLTSLTKSPSMTDASRSVSVSERTVNPSKNNWQST